MNIYKEKKNNKKKTLVRDFRTEHVEERHAEAKHKRA